METSLSSAALREVGYAIEGHLMLERAPQGDIPAERRIRIELSNLASNIRSHLQHVQARSARKPQSEKDPLLL